MLPKSILFDLDDTIVSYHPMSEPAWVKVCSDFVRPTHWVDVPTLLQSIQVAGKEYWNDPERHRLGRLDLNNARRDVVRAALQDLGCANDEAAFRLADAYSDLHQEMIDLFPGAIETLRELTARNVKLALITNGNAAKQRYKIQKFKLDQNFDVCLVEGELGFGKPDRRVFEMALDGLRVSPEESWMVGDNLDWDIKVPKAMGMFTVWNDYARRGLPDNPSIIPDRIINNIRELI